MMIPQLILQTLLTMQPENAGFGLQHRRDRAFCADRGS